MINFLCFVSCLLCVHPPRLSITALFVLLWKAERQSHSVKWVEVTAESDCVHSSCSLQCFMASSHAFSGRVPTFLNSFSSLLLPFLLHSLSRAFLRGVPWQELAWLVMLCCQLLYVSRLNRGDLCLALQWRPHRSPPEAAGSLFISPPLLIKVEFSSSHRLSQLHHWHHVRLLSANRDRTSSWQTAKQGWRPSFTGVNEMRNCSGLDLPIGSYKY